MQCDINQYSVLLDNTTEVPGADFLYLFSDSMQLSERQAFCLSVGKYLSTYFKGTDKTLSYSQSRNLRTAIFLQKHHCSRNSKP